MENIAQDDCNGLNCHCQTGYTGVGCCDCASGYFRDGSTCRGCPSGTVPDENQLQCICIPSQETKIYVKGQCICKLIRKHIIDTLNWSLASTAS